MIWFYAVLCAWFAPINIHFNIVWRALWCLGIYIIAEAITERFYRRYVVAAYKDADCTVLWFYFISHERISTGESHCNYSIFIRESTLCKTEDAARQIIERIAPFHPSVYWKIERVI